MALCSERTDQYAQKVLDRADIVRDAMLRQLSSVRRTATAASRSLLALPHSFRTAAFTNERLVYRRSAMQARVFAPSAFRRLLDAFTA
jgi:hypothetical protein